MKVFVATEGSLSGIAYELGVRAVIGRSGECDIQVMDADASRRHACVLLQDDGSVVLRDLSSSNGTRHNGQPISEVTLTPGDEVQIGQTRFEYKLVEQGEIDTEDLVVKLVSGPAMAPTLESHLSEHERAQIDAEIGRRQSDPDAERPTPAACCGSPLTLRDRQHWWRYCPVCGARLSPDDNETLETIAPGPPDDPSELN